jgi:hypothetical protein
VASRAAEERAQMERERDVQHEKMRRVINRDTAITRREKAMTLKEAEVEQKERAARHTIDGAKAAMKIIDDERAVLQQREVAVREEKARLAARLADMEARSRDLKEQKVAIQEQEAHLAALLIDMEAWTRDLKERETKVEGLLAEQIAGIERVVKWVGEANTTLDTLGISPIQVAEAPSSLGAVLPTLDSTAERLQRLESTIVGCLDAEGQELARVVVDYVLTCFRSLDPAIPLTPVLVGPVPEAVAAAREGVQEAVEIVAARFERFTGPDLQKEEGPPDRQ